MQGLSILASSSVAIEPIELVFGNVPVVRLSPERRVSCKAASKFVSVMVALWMKRFVPGPWEKTPRHFIPNTVTAEKYAIPCKVKSYTGASVGRFFSHRSLQNAAEKSPM